MSHANALTELENYKIQKQQVEAALIAEPDNDELLKLRTDLDEIITLQEELIGSAVVEQTARDGDMPPPPTSSSSGEKKRNWQVGDKCLAPSKNGQHYAAVIDGISQDRVAITFSNNGTKHMVRMSDLQKAPVEEKKQYVFDQAPSKSNSGPKKEWQMERERRKQRAQKKEMRRKQLDEAKETQKNKWLNFNNKANVKSLKGVKRVEASGVAADGPRDGGGRSTARISSRTDNKFGATSRGNMDSLF